MRVAFHAALCLFVALACLPVQARYGETLEELIARYGEPDAEKLGTMPPSTMTRNWRTKTFQFAATFYLDRAAIVTYYGQQFTATEIKAILDANADGKTWTRVPPMDRQVYLRSDKTARATITEGRTPGSGGRIEIENIKFRELADAIVAERLAKDAAERKERLEREKKHAEANKTPPARGDKSRVGGI